MDLNVKLGQLMRGGDWKGLRIGSNSDVWFWQCWSFGLWYQTVGWL